ncbi:hypothetical protein QOZ80_6BG0483230 [Eleusine coracana subsp. coracana]|nr:hypothetical protein QOZ80_6BG0483230 [Eleusine coracana subsp. coracana]
MVPKPLKGSPLLIRNIRVAGGYIKFFDMHSYVKVDFNSYDEYIYTPDGWDAVTGKMDLSKLDSEWEDDCKINISEVPSNDLVLPIPLEENKNLILIRLYTSSPVLSLHDDGVVYIMYKLQPHDDSSWVIDVDMRQQSVNDVAYFGSGRPVGHDSFTYLQSRISKHMGIGYTNR